MYENRRKISRARKNVNLTQDQLAEILDVSRQTVSKWESDLAYPEAAKLALLSNTLEVSIDYLLKNEELKKPELKINKNDNNYEVDWSSVYPILSRYENEIYMDYYFEHFSSMMKNAADKYNYSLEDAMLVLKDVFYKAYLNLIKKDKK